MVPSGTTTQIVLLQLEELNCFFSSKSVCLHFHRPIHLTEEGDGFVKEGRAPYTWKH